jgi:hypothetical protein
MGRVDWNKVAIGGAVVLAATAWYFSRPASQRISVGDRVYVQGTGILSGRQTKPVIVRVVSVGEVTFQGVFDDPSMPEALRQFAKDKTFEFRRDAITRFAP